MLQYIINRWLPFEMGPIRKLPTHINLFITSKCNAACLHCFVKTNEQKEELSLDEIERLISLKLKKLYNLNISGGEPFLREDLAEICQLFCKNNNVKKIHLPTNCLMPSKIHDISKDILERCKCRVCLSLSLDGPANLHDEIRQIKGAYDRVFETYDRVKHLKKYYANLYLNVGTVISNKNYSYIHQLVETVKTEMPDIDSHGFDWIRGKPRDTSFSLPDIEDIEKISPLLKQTRRYYAYKNKSLFSKLELSARLLVADIKLKTLQQRRQVIPCLAGYIFAVIDEAGNIYLCELLPRIGNIREKDLEKIWNSPQANAQRQYIKQKKCYCVHGCFVPSNITHNISLYPALIKKFLIKE